MGLYPIPPHFFPLAGTIGASAEQVNAAAAVFSCDDRHLPAVSQNALKDRTAPESVGYATELRLSVMTKQESGQITFNRNCDASHRMPRPGGSARSTEKGSRPVSRVLSWATIPLGCTSPCTSSDLPGNARGPRAAARSKLPAARSPIWPCSGRGLPCRACCQTRGALLPHPFTLASPGRTRDFGGLLSVALSVGSRPPGVTWRPALWSPDFPPQERRAAEATRPIAWSGCLADSRAHDRRARREAQGLAPDSPGVGGCARRRVRARW